MALDYIVNGLVGLTCSPDFRAVTCTFIDIASMSGSVAVVRYSLSCPLFGKYFPTLTPDWAFRFNRLLSFVLEIWKD